MINGLQYSGKSLIVDTMMKYILDEHNHKKIYSQPPQDKQFLEIEPGEAQITPVIIHGESDHTPIQLCYDRRSLGGIDIIKEFEKASNTVHMPKGAIFCNKNDDENSDLELSIIMPSDHINNIRYDRPLAKQMASNNWSGRTLTVKTNDPTLMPFCGQ